MFLYSLNFFRKKYVKNNVKNYGIQNEGIEDYYRNKFARMFLNSQMIH